MPHSTSPGPDSTQHSHQHTTRARATSQSSHSQPFKYPPDNSSASEKFPDYHGSHITISNGSGRSQSPNGQSHGPPSSMDRWLPRQDRPGGSLWSSKREIKGHGRQKSLSEAFRTIRTRKASVSQNAHELADALRAPVSAKLIILCIVWYMSSALTNTSSKSILNAFSKPGTLTLIQFFMVSGYCLLFSWLANIIPSLKRYVPALRYGGIRYPSRDVIMTTLPMAVFQIGGHLLSATATAKIPVATVHTIKGLSPLFTVFAYRAIFNIRYPSATYISLVPLTVGVMFACSAEFKGNFLGILYALLAAIIFVTQNIWSKRLFNEAARAEADGLTHQSRKLDKLNLLCYSSGLAFLLTAPYWFWSEGLGLLSDLFSDGALDLNDRPQAFDHGRLALEFIFNGTFHFGQNIIAFVLLSLVSPVTYSVASLIKRVVIVVFSIIWFQNPTTNVQAFGIALTFLGLYLYDRSSESNKADRKAKMMDIKEETLLPLNTRQASGTVSGGPVFESPANIQNSPYPYTNGSMGQSNPDDLKKSDDVGKGRPRGQSNATWLPAGTKQEETWRLRDGVVNGNVNAISAS